MPAFFRRYICAGLVLILGLATTTPSASAQSGDIKGVSTGPAFWAPMTFVIGPPTPEGRQRVFATGAFAAGTAQRFRDFITQNSILAPGTLIDLHSPGGDPYEGMAMGQFIRSQSYDTGVAQLNLFEAEVMHRPDVELPGVCASACSLAFLGGVYRHVSDRSLYGVHDVSADRKLPGVDLLDAGQKIAGDISGYLDQMGIDQGLLGVITRYNSNTGEIHWMSPDQMSRLGVTRVSMMIPDEVGVRLVDYRASRTIWSLESTADGFALEGRNPPASDFPGNYEKLVFACVGSPRHVVMGAIYMPEERDSDHWTPMAPAAFASSIGAYQLSALLDDGNQSYRSVAVPSGDIIDGIHVVDPHHVAVFVGVTSAMVDLLRNARRLDFGFEPSSVTSSGVDFNAGIVSVDFTDGRDQALSFIDNCR